MMAWAVQVITLQLRCADVAAAVARQIARQPGGRFRARAVAPIGASITVRREPGLVAVSVRMTARPGAHWLPGVPLQATAEVVPEPEAVR